MAVRGFDGVDDEIRCAIGNCNQTGALTLAVMFKRGTTATVWGTLIANHNPANQVKCGLETSGTAANGVEFYNGVSASTSGVNALPANTTDWVIVAVTKQAGTSLPRFHVKNVTTGTAWLHVNGTLSPLADCATQAGGTVRFGEWNDGDDFTGQLALAGEWNVALTDAQTEALATNKRTGDWVLHPVPPVAVWNFNQATVTPVQDLIDGAHETVVQGTTVVTGQDPPGWVFSGNSCASFEQTLLAQSPNAGSRARGLQAGANYRLKQLYLAGVADPAAHTAAKVNARQVKALNDAGNMAVFDAITGAY